MDGGKGVGNLDNQAEGEVGAWRYIMVKLELHNFQGFIYIYVGQKC